MFNLVNNRKAKGFTLIELLVVILIIGVLAAVAIPLFINQRAKGFDSGVRSDLRNLGASMESVYEEENDYPGTIALLEAGGANFNASEGNTIFVFVTDTPTDGFCIRGHNPDGNVDGTTEYFWYDSREGGLAKDGLAEADKPNGACATFTEGGAVDFAL